MGNLSLIHICDISIIVPEHDVLAATLIHVNIAQLSQTNKGKYRIEQDFRLADDEAIYEMCIRDSMKVPHCIQRVCNS